VNTNGSTTPGQQPISNTAIEMRGVGVMRDQRWILRNINWTVYPGTLAAILGANGSGKSTLARVAACHLWPTAGTCEILGQKFGAANLPELRRKIRLVQPAGPYDVDPSLTARQVVQTGYFGSIGLYGKVTDEMNHEVERLLRRIGLGEVIDHIYSTLSSGEKVRSLVARAMITRPRLLILDEPTAGLDLLAREQVLATMQLLMRMPHPPAIVLITHHVEELPPITSHVLLLKEGKSLSAGSMAEVLTPPILSEAYGFAVEVRRSAERYYLEVHPSAWDDLLPQDQPNV
jgi:iron complex transport system ATP-binding protein